MARINAIKIGTSAAVGGNTYRTAKTVMISAGLSTTALRLVTTADLSGSNTINMVTPLAARFVRITIKEWTGGDPSLLRGGVSGYNE